MTFFKIIMLISMGYTLSTSQTVSSLMSSINSNLYSNSRSQLRQLTNEAAAGNTSAQNQHENALVAELSKNHSWQAKAMALIEIQLIAKQESTVDELAKLLGDNNLVEPAVEAIIHIGRYAHDEQNQSLYDKTRSAVRTGLNGSTGDIRRALLKAAGSLRDHQSVDTFITDAGSNNAEIKRMALRALANTGDPKAKTTILNSLSTTNEYDLGMFLDFALLYSVRLAQRGDNTTALDVAQAIEDLPGDCPHYLTAAAFAKTDIASASPDFGLPSLVSSIELKYGLNDRLIKVKLGKLSLNHIPSSSYVIELTDLKGRKIFQKNYKAHESFSIRKQPVGVYWAKVKILGKKEILQKVTLF